MSHRSVRTLALVVSLLSCACAPRPVELTDAEASARVDAAVDTAPGDAAPDDEASRDAIADVPGDSTPADDTYRAQPEAGAPDASELDAPTPVDVTVPPSDVFAPLDTMPGPDAVTPVDAMGPAGAPRAIAPLSTATVSSQRPTLRWQLGANSDGAEVTLCRDRALRTGCQSFVTAGSSGRPATALARGWWFWGLRARQGMSTTSAQSAAVWQFWVNARSADGDRDLSYGAHADLNGDGFADVIAGALGPADRGRVTVHHGSASGVATSAAQSINGSADRVRFSTGLAVAGDVNGDGFVDLAAAETQATIAGLSEAGVVHVYFGGPAGIAATPSQSIPGPGAGERFGETLTTVGDIDRDGYAELAVSSEYARMAGSTRGRITIYRGSAAGLITTAPMYTLWGPRAGAAGLGRNMSSGDLNGDGFVDFVTSAPSVATTGTGSVQVFLGSASGLPTAPSRVIEGAAESQGFGLALDADGDVNGDGYTDLLVGAIAAAPGGRMNAGQAFVYLGSTAGLSATPVRTWAGAVARDLLGTRVCFAGDGNGDGFDDMLVAIPAATMGTAVGAGAVAVSLGGAGGPGDLALMALQGLATSDSFGWSLGAPGDTNGDGLADVAIGAVGADVGGLTSAGAVSVVQGAASGYAGARPAVRLDGDVAQRALGWTVE